LQHTKHKELMDELYQNPKFPEAVDLWTSFFADSPETIQYSNWRHLNPKRQAIENKVWKKIITPGSKILDLGCGKGFFLKRLYENFGTALEYFGVDISSTAIQQAQAYFNLARYFIAAGEKLPFAAENFDAILIISTLEHVESPALVLQEAYRVLKSGGYLYLVFHKRSLDPLILYTLYALALKFLKKFVPKKLEPDNKQYTFPISRVRAETFKSLQRLKCRKIERGDLVSEVNLAFYRKLKVPISWLMKVAEATNRLPCSLFKNLEYWVYQK
jgi:ubiquinone/menaquinone biosynthesis C-methylase UbiE